MKPPQLLLLHRRCEAVTHVCLLSLSRLPEACPSSANGQRDTYLNTGLTSTKNYGKTILTKVG